MSLCHEAGGAWQGGEPCGMDGAWPFPQRHHVKGCEGGECGDCRQDCNLSRAVPLGV